LILETQNLTKTYQFGSSTITAIKNVNLEIENGTFVSIAGPSGSGKTTLLNLIGLLSHPTSGKIFFKGEDTSQLSERERRKFRLSNIGFVFQIFNLIPTLTAQENVELPMAFARVRPDTQRERAKDLLQLVGLTHRTCHRPKQLSAGEMQRVAIVRALANNPSLIIADEPTGELDTQTGLNIINLLLNLCKTQGKTIVIATHDEKIKKIADVVYESYARSFVRTTAQNREQTRNTQENGKSDTR